MLARVADNLYWMSRYLERADQTIRLLGVQVRSVADHTSTQVAAGWTRLFRSLKVTPPGGDPLYSDQLEDSFLLADAYTLADFMSFERDNPGSMVSLWGLSRENARQARQEITQEMWGQLNRTYLSLRDTQLHLFWNKEPENFYRETSAQIYLFRGVTDNGLRHGLAWDFIRLGRFMERIQVTTEILDSYRAALDDEDTELDWSLLLRSCASFEPYCRHYTPEVDPWKVMTFLIHEPESPHTLRFAAEEIRNGLGRIDPAGGARHPLQAANRIAGQLRALLAYGSQERDELANTLAEVRRLSRGLHDEIYRRYIFYPAGQALPGR